MRKRKPLQNYPGDEAIINLFAQVIKETRLKAGMAIEETEAAVAKIHRTYDYKPTARALGVVIKEARERAGMSKRELARVAELPLHLVDDVEAATTKDVWLTDLVRLAFALGLDLVMMMQRVETLEEKFRKQ